LDAVAAYLPDVRNLAAVVMELGDPVLNEGISIELEALRRLEVALIDVRNTSPPDLAAVWGQPTTNPRKNSKEWHGIAKHLETAFVAAMRSTNPKLDIGLSNEGPVTRFVVAVVPHLTGEDPTAQGVAQHLKRLKAKRIDKPAS